MKIATLQDLYLVELQELRSVTVQFEGALERLADAASNPSLKKIFARQQKEIRAEAERLDKMLQQRDVGGDGHTDQAMEALVREMEKMISLIEGNELRDVALIGSTQRLEHYQIAAYGTVAALAGHLDLRSEQKALHSMVDNKKKIDIQLTELATAKVNPSALAA